MGFIPQVKCSRCDRKYSGLLAKCPYCGARRNKKGVRAVTNDNSTWKMVIGLLLLVVLIAAVIVLVVTSVTGNNNNENVADDNQNDTPDNVISSDEGVNSVGDDAVIDHNNITGDDSGTTGTPGTTDDPTNPGTTTDDPTNPGTNTDDPTNPTDPGTTGTPETPVTPVVTNIVITYAGSPVGVNNEDLGMREFSMATGETLTLGISVTPSDAEYEAVWASDNEDVIIILQDGSVSAVGAGTATISVTAGSVTTSVFVRVRG